MTKRLLFLTLLISINYSCGILGLYQDNINRDPAYQAKMFAEINSQPLALYMDSLIREIDAASLVIPNDLQETTLIVETYNEYSDYLKSLNSKYSIHTDTKKIRRYFKKYQKKKNELIKDPKFNVIYLDKSEYDKKDIKEFKYVLKSTIRLDYDPNNLTIDNNGFIAPFVGTQIYYIWDRNTNAVFREIKDLTILSEKK